MDQWNILKFFFRIKFGYQRISPPDCAAYLRSHLVEDEVDKVRAVWGYPATIGLQEACFALPLIAAYKSGKYPLAYGYETATGGHIRIQSRFCGYHSFLSSDYKSFDKTVPAWLIRIAFDILLLGLDFTRYDQQGVPDAEALYKVWKYLIDYFINTPIRLCTGERYKKKAGIASGSYFTQLIGSIVNWIVTTYALRKCGAEIKDLIVLGDDSLVGLTQSVNLESFAYFVGKCGMILNTEKTQMTANLWTVKFLGYQMTNGIPMKPEKEFWASLKYPEHPDSSFDEYATRAIGLLLATFGRYDDFYNAVAGQLKTPYRIVMKASLRRWLEALGIHHLPKVPPTIQELGGMALRAR